MIQSLTSFVGMFPRYTTYTLPQTAAQNLVDGRVTSNGLEAYRADLIVRKEGRLYADLYRHYRQDGTSKWLFFDTSVDVVRSGVLDDLTNRTFISGLVNSDTGTKEFRLFDTDSLENAPDENTITKDNSCLVGVPTPSNIRMSVEEEGVGSEESRSYVVAYGRWWKSGNKMDMGDISSPVQTSSNTIYIDCKTDSHIKISGIRTRDYIDEYGVSQLLADHGVTGGATAFRAFIYRSSVASDGTASYRYVTDFPLEPGGGGGPQPPNVFYAADGMSVDFLDTLKEEDLGEQANNIGWSAPPRELEGVVTLNNGVLAGFKDNTVYLSVPYQGHAWPAAYRYPSDFKVRGLGTFGNTLVVCTEAITYLLNASDPSLAFLTPIQEAHACVSKESICSLDNACVYATKYGLIRITGNGAEVISREFISDLEWIKLNPPSIRASMHKGMYVMFWDSDDKSLFDLKGYVIDFNEPERGVVGISQGATGIFNDPVDNALYLMYKYNVDGQPVVASFADASGVRKAFTWTSKTFLDNTGLFTLSAGKVNFYEGRLNIKEEDDDVVYELSFNPLNHHLVNVFSINGDANTFNKNKATIGVGNKWCQLSLYVDDVLRHTEHVVNNKPFRLPAGFRGDSYYITITSTEPITRVQVASSIGELE